MRKYALAIAGAVLLALGAALVISSNSESRVVSSVRIHREIADVFDFFTTPKNWPRWHPASISVAGATDHSLAIGEEVSEEIRAGSGKVDAVWRVTARDAPHLWRFEGSRGGRGGLGGFGGGEEEGRQGFWRSRARPAPNELRIAIGRFPAKRKSVSSVSSFFQDPLRYVTPRPEIDKSRTHTFAALQCCKESIVDPSLLPLITCDAEALELSK